MPHPPTKHHGLYSSHTSPRYSLSLTICLVLTLGPSIFLASSPSATFVCDAAPALWSPLAEALEHSGDLLGSLFKPTHHEEAVDPATLQPTAPDAALPKPALDPAAASADDFGVVHLDLEGDPNCDYTTKVNIAGSEYNVIIDTGSAHFAVASSACHDCVIPHKEHYRPNEPEEEIPIDMDTDLAADQDEPLHLFRPPPPAQGSTLSPTFSSAIPNQSSHPLPPSSSLTPTPPHTPHPSLVHTPALLAPSRIPSRDQAVLDLHAKVDFAQRQSQLNKLKSALPGSKETTMAKPNPYLNTVAQKPLAVPSLLPVLNWTRSKGEMALRGKNLAMAPAENLYPLSSHARDHGQTVRVSYGIQSHSVGWSGVMTSDLMTLSMAKVEPKGSFSKPLSDAVLESGGIMEKETNVEFAAIMENTGFFSQECGAQHGIWGLGYRTLSLDRKPTLLDTLSAAMKIPNGFGLQLCGRTANTTKSGNLFLGGYAQDHVAEPMQYVPLVKKDWYQVRLDGFRVMGLPVRGMQNLNLPKTIVDSGTTNILMSHYNLQAMIQSLSQSDVIRWSGLIPVQDINNFWFKNAVLRLPRSSFQVSTAARSVEVVLSGVPIPIYTSSFLRIKPVPAGQAPAGYVDFWWHGLASSTSPDQVEAERASGGAVMPGSVGTILGETLFAGKVVYFERGRDEAQPGDADFGRIGFARGQNCYAPADHASINVLASKGQVAKVEGLGPVRVAATSHANAQHRPSVSALKPSRNPLAHAATVPRPVPESPPPVLHTVTLQSPSAEHSPHPHGFSGPIRLMGQAADPVQLSSLVYRLWWGLAVALVARML